MEEPSLRRRRRSSTKSEDAGAQSRSVFKGDWIPLLFMCFGLFSITQAVNIYLRVAMGIKYQEVLEEREAVKQEIEMLNQALQGMTFQMSEGWVYFNGSWYLGSSTKHSWEESRKFCQERGADLIIITSEQEQIFARETFVGCRWIGLTDVEQKGVWKWVDGSLLNTSYWYPGEPDQEYEHCAEILSEDWLRNWVDRTCSERRFCICEK